MDDEERKLQIKLAQLQTDVQIWLTICFGSIAVLYSLIIASWQQFFSTPDSQTSLKSSLLGAMFIGIAGMICITIYCAKQMQDKRNEMDKL